MGLDYSSLLNWKYHAEQAIDHVVLGRGPPGGAWQVTNQNPPTQKPDFD